LLDHLACFARLGGTPRRMNNPLALQVLELNLALEREAAGNRVSQRLREKSLGALRALLEESEGRLVEVALPRDLRCGHGHGTTDKEPAQRALVNKRFKERTGVRSLTDCDAAAHCAAANCAHRSRGGEPYKRLVCAHLALRLPGWFAFAVICGGENSRGVRQGYATTLKQGAVVSLFYLGEMGVAASAPPPPANPPSPLSSQSARLREGPAPCAEAARREEFELRAPPRPEGRDAVAPDPVELARNILDYMIAEQQFSVNSTMDDSEIAARLGKLRAAREALNA